MSASLTGIVRAAYVDARSKWTGADWTHERLSDGALVRDCSGEPIYCDGCAGCDVCSGAARDSAAAESLASTAMQKVETGDYVGALDLAGRARALEVAYGDCPTWGAFFKAIYTLIEIENGDG